MSLLCSFAHVVNMHHRCSKLDLCPSVNHRSAMAKRVLAATNPDKASKQLRSNMDETKKIFDTIPIVHWRLQIHKREWLVESVDTNLAIVQRGIERMQVAPPTQVEIQGNKVYTLARETLNLMDEASKIVSDGKLDIDIDGMRKFIDEYGRTSHQQATGQLNAIDAKLVFYARQKDLKTSRDRDELLNEKMRLTHTELIDGKPFDIQDAVYLAKDYLKRACGIKDLILQYEDLSDATDLSRIQTKPQLNKACRALRRKNYAELWRSATCSVCLEQKFDTFQCENWDCTHYLCSGCFATAAYRSWEENFHDVEKTRSIATLECFFCHNGTISSDICRAMPACDVDIFLHAVEINAYSEKASEMAAEKAEEITRYRGLSSSEKLFRLEKEIIGELIAIKCPLCSRKYGDFDGCAALTCHCGAHFCGLCGEGKFDDDEACHAHVASCPERPIGMTDSLFVENLIWRSHVADRQQLQVKEYVDSTDLAVELKEKLLDFFSVP